MFDLDGMLLSTGSVPGLDQVWIVLWDACHHRHSAHFFCIHLLISTQIHFWITLWCTNILSTSKLCCEVLIYRWLIFEKKGYISKQFYLRDRYLSISIDSIDIYDHQIFIHDTFRENINAISKQHRQIVNSSIIDLQYVHNKALQFGNRKSALLPILAHGRLGKINIIWRISVASCHVRYDIICNYKFSVCLRGLSLIAPSNGLPKWQNLNYFLHITVIS